MPLEMIGLRIPLAKYGQIYAFYIAFVHTKHTFNMAACYVNDYNDITLPHVYSFPF